MSKRLSLCVAGIFLAIFFVGVIMTLRIKECPQGAVSSKEQMALLHLRCQVAERLCDEHMALNISTLVGEARRNHDLKGLRLQKAYALALYDYTRAIESGVENLLVEISATADRLR